MGLMDELRSRKSLSGFMNYMRSTENLGQDNIDKVIRIITEEHLHCNYEVGYDVIFKEILAGPVDKFKLDDITFLIYPNGISRGSKTSKTQRFVSQKFVIVLNAVTGQSNDSYLEILQMKSLPYKRYVQTPEEEKKNDNRMNDMIEELEEFIESIKDFPWYKN